MKTNRTRGQVIEYLNKWMGEDEASDVYDWFIDGTIKTEEDYKAEREQKAHEGTRVLYGEFDPENPPPRGSVPERGLW